MATEETLYQLVGGRPCLERVHKIFYNKLFNDPQLGQFFKDVKQEVQEAQQTDFMSQLMGGPSIYCGKLPVPAHMHMYITEDLFNKRSQILKASIKEAGVADDLAARWLKLDNAFKAGIVKKTIEDCKLRFPTDQIIALKDWP